MEMHFNRENHPVCDIKGERRLERAFPQCGGTCRRRCRTFWTICSVRGTRSSRSPEFSSRRRRHTSTTQGNNAVRLADLKDSEPEEVQAHLGRILALDPAVDDAQDKLTRQADLRIVEVASVDHAFRCVGNGHVQVQVHLAVLLRDIAHAGDDLHIAGVARGLIHELLAIEHAERHVVHRADPIDGGQHNIFLCADLTERGEDFLALLNANHTIRPETTVFHICTLLLPVDNVDRAAGEESLDVLRCRVHDALAAALRAPRHMGSDDAVFGLEQGIVGADRLGGHHVQAGEGDLAAVECVSQILFDDHLAAAVVDDDDAVFHLGDVFLPDDAV